MNLHSHGLRFAESCYRSLRGGAGIVLLLAGLAVAAGLVRPPNALAKDAPVTSDTNPRNLPFSQGKSFSTLDEYLAHLERMGTMDRPFYREVSPGLYELVVGSPTVVPPSKKFYTREELLEKYGFEE